MGHKNKERYLCIFTVSVMGIQRLFVYSVGRVDAMILDTNDFTRLTACVIARGVTQVAGYGRIGIGTLDPLEKLIVLHLVVRAVRAILV